MLFDLFYSGNVDFCQCQECQDSLTKMIFFIIIDSK